jgi:hypothetical protein
MDTRKTAESFGNAAFLRAYQQRHHRELEYMNTALAAKDDCPTFRGLILDPGANQKSFMPLEQYLSYCRAFGVPVEIRPLTERVGGIC